MLISSTFSELNKRRRAALIPFITCGDPTLSLTASLLPELVRSGADIIELGVPFSDPMADGSVIQRASERALKNKVSLASVLEVVSVFRKTNVFTPLVLMGYANSIEQYGVMRFAQDAASAGVSGVLIVDYPPEECEVFAQALQRHNVDRIFMVAPTTSNDRIHLIAQWASGYLYYVSLRGVTGSACFNLSEVAQRLALIKKKTPLPVAVGFGIRDADTASQVAAIAEGVVIGSRLIEELEAGLELEQASSVSAVCSWLEQVSRSMRAIKK